MNLVNGVETGYQKMLKRTLVKPKQRKVRRADKKTPLQRLLDKRARGR